MKTVFIDMYGVILKESKGNFVPFVRSRLGDEAVAFMRKENLFTRTALGEFTAYEFLSRLGFNHPRAAMEEYLKNHLTLDEGFIPFAERYYNQCSFVLLSNDVSEWSRFITEYHGLNKYFQNKIVSGDVGCRKPDNRIFEIALKGKNPIECAFIDNSVSNLVSAEALGITPILFNRDNEAYSGLTVNSFKEITEKRIIL